MSGTTHPTPAADVHIDRLVLDIPGLDPSQLHALAEGIAGGLAGAGGSGQHDTVRIDLSGPPGAPADLAARIVAALMQRLA